MCPSDRDLITHRENSQPKHHSKRTREGRPIRNTWAKQLARGPVKAPCVSLKGQLRLPSCEHFCADMAVFSAVCNDRFFIWLSTWGTWSQKVGVGASGYFRGAKCSLFIHHGSPPDGLTLSTGDLAATSLRDCHSFFVCYRRKHQWYTWNQAVLLRLGTMAFAVGLFFFFEFHLCIWVFSRFSVVTHGCIWFSFKTHYKL